MIENWSPQTLQEKLDSGANVFLKLWQEGCGPCTLSIPAFQRLADDNPHKLLFAQINVDEHPEMLDMLDDKILPAFFIFKNKNLAGRFQGFKGITRLTEFMDQSVTS